MHRDLSLQIGPHISEGVKYHLLPPATCHLSMKRDDQRKGADQQECADQDALPRRRFAPVGRLLFGLLAGVLSLVLVLPVLAPDRGPPPNVGLLIGSNDPSLASTGGAALSLNAYARKGCSNPVTRRRRVPRRSPDAWKQDARFGAC